MEAPDSLLKSLHKRLLFLNRISLADMESTGCPLNLSLKVEEQEEEIQSRALESGPTDTQKVRICSEGGWVSECAGVAAAPGGRAARSQAVVGLLLGRQEVKIAGPRPPFAFLRKVCYEARRHWLPSYLVT